MVPRVVSALAKLIPLMAPRGPSETSTETGQGGQGQNPYYDQKKKDEGTPAPEPQAAASAPSPTHEPAPAPGLRLVQPNGPPIAHEQPPEAQIQEVRRTSGLRSLIGRFSGKKAASAEARSAYEQSLRSQKVSGTARGTLIDRKT